nr:hypothetical protein CFP56_65073 [Quercus suber]
MGFVFYPWPLHAQNKPKHFVDLEDLAMEAVELEALAIELRLNELGKIRRERGELGLGSEGGITVMKLRKLTQLTHGVRKSTWQRYGRPTTPNPETHHYQSCRSRNPPR